MDAGRPRDRRRSPLSSRTGTRRPTFVGARLTGGRWPRPGAEEEPSAMTTTTPSAAAGPTLEVRGVTKRYGARAAVAALSFVCHPRTATGFLGPTGAGKSTTLRILTGLATADEGEALVGGAPYRSLAHPARTIGVMLDARALHGGR